MLELCGHDSSIFLKSYDQSETTSGMYFGAAFFIYGLRCLIRDDTQISKNRNPHYRAGSFQTRSEAWVPTLGY
jgi:hypothetical protein